MTIAEIHELTIIDESILDDEVNCEAAHRYVKECGPVAYRMFTSCGLALLTCAPVVEHPEQGVFARREMPNIHCIDCGKPARECWDAQDLILN